MKKCTSCQIEKEFSEFRFRKDRNSYIAICRVCEAFKKAEYAKTHKPQQAISRHLYYLNNKDKERENNKKWLLDNKSERAKYHTEYEKKRKEIDPSFRIRVSVSKLINNYFILNGLTKGNLSFLKFVGWNLEELKQHLESLFEPWMSWNNWGKYNPKEWDDNNTSTWTWNIDHIVPHSTFKYSSMEDDDFKKCWALSNLRPLSSKQNLLDGSKRTRHQNVNKGR